ncbi:hypothetical protein LI177_14020 [bacterium 210820-DFI.6.37]|nr:hypothetical protein [bacterium 210820-DFI.6.37]
MRKKVLCFVLAFALCLSFAACTAASEPEEPSESTEPSTEAPAKDKVFKTSDELFQITADENWSPAEESLNIEDAGLVLAKEAETADAQETSQPAEASENEKSGETADGYIALISEYKYNFSEGLSGYNKLVVKHMEKNVDEEKTSQSEELKLGEHDAYKTVMSGKVEELEVTYAIYCAEVDSYYVQLICWSPDASQDKLAAEFDKIARSLRSAEETEE